MNTRPEDYAINEHGWRDGESNADHARRVMTAEEQANGFFAKATVPQNAAFHAAMSRAKALFEKDTPTFNRARDAALAVFRRDTQAARDLFNRTADCIMATGEVSEDLSREWDFLINPARAAELWADDLAEQVVAQVKRDARPARLVVVGDHTPEAA